LTLATKAPRPRGTNRLLYHAYKYPDNEGTYSLHCTVSYSRPNPQGFRIRIGSDKIRLENSQAIDAYCPLTVFEDVLKLKTNQILLVYAKTVGNRKTGNEKFLYDSAYLLSGLNFEKFQSAVTTDKLKVDIRIGSFRSGAMKGKYHDHGTAFRIDARDYL